MATITIRIPYVAWRAGRPRFSPGPELRALRFKGQDLKHPNGQWYTAEEAQAWVAAKLTDIEAAWKAKSEGKRLPRQRIATPVVTIEDLFEAWFKSPRLAGTVQREGKRNLKPLAPATVADYRAKRNALMRHDGELWLSAVDALTRQIVYGLFEDLWKERGLHMARGIILTLSSAMGWGMKTGLVKLAVNPCEGLGMTMPEPRVRAGTLAEIRQLVAAADLIGRPEIGDSITLGVWQGQRQNDRLAMVEAGLLDGRHMVRQHKTGAIVELFAAPELEARLSAAKARRQGATVQHPQLVIDEQLNQPWDRFAYSKCFGEVRAAAGAGIKDGQGRELLAPMPSVADLRDQDLRDTAVTWLARAGCTHAQIASITGHSEASVHSILKHYLSHHRDLADAAIARLVSWYDGQEKRA